MTEDEWYERGDKRLEEWRAQVKASMPDYAIDLTDNEKSAFEYAWELAGREMGIVE